MALRVIKDMARKSTLKRFATTGLVAIIVNRFSRWLNWPYPSAAFKSAKHRNLAVGDYGERVAVDWLRANGIRVLRRNFKAPRGGEVDIIARDGTLLLFIEVKTRAEGARVRPLSAVDRDKQRLIERGANSWLKKLHRRDIPWRFDVIEVWVAEGQRPRVHQVKNFF